MGAHYTSILTCHLAINEVKLVFLKQLRRSGLLLPLLLCTSSEYSGIQKGGSKRCDRNIDKLFICPHMQSIV